VAAEVPSGYGTSLIRELIPHELRGTVDLVLTTDGVSRKIGSLLSRHGRLTQRMIIAINAPSRDCRRGRDAAAALFPDCRLQVLGSLDPPGPTPV
jgi:hypothetical protein